MSITTQEYTKRNMMGFEGDTIAKEKCRHIIESNKINTVIETGTFLGGTTRLFSQWVDNVYTIEINKENYEKSKVNLEGYNNVRLLFGDSPIKLNEVLSSIDKDQPLFLFLDAHFYDVNPLLDELKVIADNGLKPIIAIHDFKVPGKPEFGYDTYNGQDYDWGWIRGAVEKIYGEDYEVEYNGEATGAKRGIVFLFPKK